LHTMPTGFDHYSVMWDQGSYFDPDFIEESEEGPVWKKNKGYSTDIVVDKCLDWLGQRDTENPFMLLCHFKSPHWTWEPDEKHKEMYRDETIPEPETFNHRFDEETGPPDRLQIKLETVHEHWKITRWGPMPEGLSMQEQKERNFQHFIKDYLRCVASVDDNVGRLLDYLDERDLADNTVVMYTSDNGMFQGDHGWVDKRMMYEESLRVPFLVRYPEGITAGTDSTDLVTNCDYAPTILDYAGVDVPEDIQGRSLCSVFRGEPPEDWRSAFYHQHFSGTPDGEVANCGVRTKDHKLIWYNHHFDHYQLFDVNKDPLEINDVFGDPEYADIVEDMKALLRQERARVGLTDELETQIFNCEGVAETRKQMQAIPKMLTENTERLARASGK